MDLRSKSGDIRKVSLSGDIIDLNGEPHLLNSCRDITDNKFIEKEMARLDRLNLI